MSIGKMDTRYTDLTEISRRTRVPTEELDAIVRGLVKLYDPLRVYLFGSFAWGEPHWNSDLDFCCVVESEEDAEDRGRADDIFNRFNRRYTDFYLLSRKEFEKLLSNPASMEHKIHYNANVLYAVADVVFDENQPLCRTEEQWLNKARAHLKIAKNNYKDEDGEVCKLSLFHVQQCVETSLKAFRAFHLQTLIKTHKLALLRQLCWKIDPAIKTIERFSSHAAKRISEYYWLRYDKKVKIPVDMAGIEAEIEIAANVFNFVKHYIETTEPPTESTVVVEDETERDA